MLEKGSTSKAVDKETLTHRMSKMNKGTSLRALLHEAWGGVQKSGMLTVNKRKERQDTQQLELVVESLELLDVNPNDI